MTNSTRLSNFELLRLICIFGIISMHTLGYVNNEVCGMNLFIGVLINTVFNMGVTIFMLISGYFGIKNLLKNFSLFGLQHYYIQLCLQL